MIRVHRPRTPTEWSQAQALLHDHAEWIRVAAGFEPFIEQPAFAAELDDLASHYDHPGRALFLARHHDVAAGVVAVWCHPDGSAELKRMFVRAFARGRGVADALLANATTYAAETGCRDLWLETLEGVMDRAIAVYQRHGFAVASDQTSTLGVGGVVVMRRAIEPELCHV